MQKIFKKRGYLFFLIVLAGLLIAFIAAQIIMNVVTVSVSADSYYIEKVTYSDNNFDIHGGTTNSSIKFTGFFTYRIAGDSLFVKPYYSLITSSKRNGDFKIGIKIDNKNIDKIYIVGKQNYDFKQIWQKSN